MQHLLVGLGNPGAQYEHTRHNAGFMVMDALASKWGADWKAWQNLGMYAKVSVEGREVYLLKPTTYMNESGRAVSSLARFFKIPPQHLLVCFDDVSLDVGQIRLRKSGSAGGQNGMKSVIAQLGTQDIPRLRMGIGPKPEKFDLANFVLSNFPKSDLPALETALEHACSAVERMLSDGLEKAMNQYN